VAHSNRGKAQARQREEPAAPTPARNVEPWAWLAFATAIALILGGLTHWVIFEYDLFWQVRAGREILSGSGVQRVEHWSFTAYGQPWFNFQWLATVVDYLVYRIGGGYSALGWLRAILVAGWIFALAGLIRRTTGPNWSAWVLTLLLAPWIYVACSFRLQMQPDLFAAGCNVILLTIWLSGVSSRAKRNLSLVVLIVWANFHSGTCPLGIFFFSAAVLFDCESPAGEPWARRAAWAAAGLATWFLTPIGWRVVDVVVRNAVTYDYSVTRNPDHRPFDLSLLEYRNGGWCLLLWAAYTLLAAISTIRLVSRRGLLPQAFRKLPFLLSVEIAFTVLALRNIHAVYYQMVFLLPVVAAGLHSFAAPFCGRARFWVPVVAAAAGIAALWGFFVPDQVATVSKPIGARVYDVEIPVQSVDFIKQNHPAGHILNAYPFGGYLVGELPEYPVAIDGRELPFFAFSAEQRSALASAASFAEFLRRRGINTVLEKPPGMIYDPAHGFSDTHALMFPQSDWAQVFFDNASVVYLRRVPENAAIIARHEYRALRRGLPPNFGAQFQGLPDATRAAHEAELDRCLAENPRCAYCLVGKAAFHHRRGNDGAAVEMLQHALAVNPTAGEAMVVLSGIYEGMGRKDEAAQLKHRFERQATPANL